MEMSESPLRRGDSLERSPDMSPDLAYLAVEALSTPAPDVFLQIVPDESHSNVVLLTSTS